MMPTADALPPPYEFALAAPRRARAWKQRAQLALKRFVHGAPEDEFVAMAAPRRGMTHLTIFALLTLPLALAQVAQQAGGIARAALLLTLLAGVALAARLEGAGARPQPAVEALGALLLALAIAGLLSLAARAALPLLDARLALALVVLALAALSVRGDPRLCAFASALGALALVAFAAHHGAFTSAALAPDLAIVAAAGVSTTLAANRRRSLARSAIRDAASGALHESAFARCLAAAHARAREAQQPLSVARIELASLHRIRQTHGDALANALMRWLASSIADRFRTTDLLGRVHESAFAMALVDADHPGVARRFDQLCEQLSTIALVKNGQREPIALELAVGIAALPREALDPTSALKLAEQRAALARWQQQRAA